MREIANNILSNFSSKYTVRQEPKDLKKFVKNTDTIVCFDLYSDRNLNQIFKIFRNCRKLFYVSFDKKNQFMKKNNCNINLKIIYETDISIYEFSRL